MTKYGRIHTDGSLDDSQPTQGYGVVTAANYTSPIGGGGTGLQTVVIRKGMAACTDRIGGAGVVPHGVVGVATQIDVLREALEAAPLIGRTESVYDFMERQEKWLNGPYRAALERSK